MLRSKSVPASDQAGKFPWKPPRPLSADAPLFRSRGEGRVTPDFTTIADRVIAKKPGGSASHTGHETEAMSNSNERTNGRKVSSSLDAAQSYVRAGLSVIPIRRDGSKAPDCQLLPKESRDDGRFH